MLPGDVYNHDDDDDNNNNSDDDDDDGSEIIKYDGYSSCWW